MSFPKLPVKCRRETRETRVEIGLASGAGLRGSTGIPFFNHLLDTLATHLGVCIEVVVDVVKDSGDDHHIVEDVAIALGRCLDEALASRSGLARFGYALIPMDDALAYAAVDLVKRPYFYANNVSFKRDVIGGLALENVTHFLRTLALEAKFTLHVGIVYGDNDHHKAEALFKAVAVAMREALKPGVSASTKGVL